MQNKGQLRTNAEPAATFWDRIFAEELNLAITTTEEAYSKYVNFHFTLIPSIAHFRL